jgi:hypothetical protein
MKITSLRLEPPSPTGVVARFDVEISDDLKLLQWRLKRDRDGQFRVFPPTLKGAGSVSAAVAPPLARSISDAASLIYSETKGRAPHVSD